MSSVLLQPDEMYRWRYVSTKARSLGRSALSYPLKQMTGPDRVKLIGRATPQGRWTERFSLLRQQGASLLAQVELKTGGRTSPSRWTSPITDVERAGLVLEGQEHDAGGRLDAGFFVDGYRAGDRMVRGWAGEKELPADTNLALEAIKSTYPQRRR